MRVNGILHRILRSKFARDISLYTFFSAIQKCIPFLLLIVLSRVFSKEEMGYFILYQAIYCLVLPVFTLNCETPISINYFKLTRKDFNIYFTNTILSHFIFFIILFCIAFPLSKYISPIAKFPAYWIIVTILSAFPRIIINSALNLFRNMEYIKKFGQISILSSILNNGIALVLLFCFHLSWKSMILGTLLGEFIVSLVCLHFVSSFISFGYNKRYVLDSFKIGFPVSISTVGSWLSNSYNRIIVSSVIGVAATGSFGVGCTFAMVLNFIIDSVNLAFAPFLYNGLSNLNDDNKYRIVKTSVAFYIIIVIMSIFIAVIGYFSLDMFFGDKYASARELIVPMVISSCFLGFYKVHVNCLFFAKKTYINAIITIIVGVINVWLSYILVRSRGVMGAAYSAIIVAMLMYFATMAFATSEYHLNWKKNIFKLLNRIEYNTCKK